jgi:hypothetical protein
MILYGLVPRKSSFRLEYSVHRYFFCKLDKIIYSKIYGASVFVSSSFYMFLGRIELLFCYVLGPFHASNEYFGFLNI